MKAKNGAKLIFLDEGKSVYIQFSNGSESVSYDSKAEAIAAIRDCVGMGKITKSDANKLEKEIVLAENLQDNDPRMLAGLAIPLMLLAALFAEEFEEEEPLILDPYVDLCKCGEKIPHAYIYNGDGKKISPPFRFKHEGLAFVERLLKTERITDGDSSGLNTMIDMLPLPEHPGLN